MVTEIRGIRVVRIASAVTLIALAGCGDVFGPGGSGEPTPFYIYQGERIDLRVDSTRITASLAAGMDTSLVRTTLTTAGVAVDSIRPLLPLSDHWLVHLAGTRSGAATERAARLLRQTSGLDFASAAYLPVDQTCPLLPINRLAVHFRTGATAAEINRLNADTGVRLHSGDSLFRMYLYPVNTRSTPLEIAAYYHRQRIVEWSSADWFDTCKTYRIGA